MAHQRRRHPNRAEADDAPEQVDRYPAQFDTVKFNYDIFAILTQPRVLVCYIKRIQVTPHVRPFSC